MHTYIHSTSKSKCNSLGSLSFFFPSLKCLGLKMVLLDFEIIFILSVRGKSLDSSLFRIGLNHVFFY